MSDTKIDWQAVKAELNSVIDQVKPLNVNVEVCGNWIWISGDNTRYYAKLFRSLGCEYSKTKEMWFFSPSTLPKFKKKSDQALSIDQIRRHHGTNLLNTASVSSGDSKKVYQKKSYVKPGSAKSRLVKFLSFIAVVCR